MKTRRDLQRWLQFWAFGSEWEEDKMSAILQDVPEVQAAYNEYKRFTSDPVIREKLESRERFLIDQRLDRAEAFADGEANKAREVAQNFKRLGVPIATIAEATGLSLSEVERLG